MYIVHVHTLYKVLCTRTYYSYLVCTYKYVRVSLAVQEYTHTIRTHLVSLSLVSNIHVHMYIKHMYKRSYTERYTGIIYTSNGTKTYLCIRDRTHDLAKKIQTTHTHADATPAHGLLPGN